MKRTLLIGLSSLFLFGCASKLKKQCQATNWFEYGKSVAMSGKRLDADDFAQRCEAEDVPVNFAVLDQGFKAGMGKYCIPETVFETGKKGQEFNPSLCDGSNIPKLKKQHKRGVRVFCQPENGYRLGAKGEPLNKICPEDMAKAFLKRHSSGRVVYLSEMAKQKESEIQLAKQQMGGYRRDLSRKERQLSRLPFVSEPKKDKKGKPVRELTNRERSILERRQSLSSSIRNLERKIDGLRKKQVNLRQEITKYRSEATALKAQKDM